MTNDFSQYNHLLTTTDAGILTLKFSNPKISRTPMNRLASVPGLVQELIWLTNQVNARE